MCWQADTRQDERELRNLRRAIRDHVGDVVEAESDVHMVEQIVGELLGNVQRYAPGPFCTEVHAEDNALHLAVHDPGPCFRPDGVASESAGWEAERGRGIAIIRALGGTIETYRADGKGCRVSVRIALGKREGAWPAPSLCPHGHPAARGAHCPRIQRYLTGVADRLSREDSNADGPREARQ